MPTLPIAKFTGKYGDLIPDGYIFQKLYASNYRTYRKEFSITKDWLVIWQYGNNIELMSLFSMSGWVIKCIIKNRDKIPEMMANHDVCKDSFSIVLNTKNGKIRYYDKAERWHTIKIERRLYDRIDTKDNTALDLYYKKYQKLHIHKDMIKEVLKLWDAGLIAFEDKEFTE